MQSGGSGDLDAGAETDGNQAEQRTEEERRALLREEQYRDRDIRTLYRAQTAGALEDPRERALRDRGLVLSQR